MSWGPRRFGMSFTRDTNDVIKPVEYLREVSVCWGSSSARAGAAPLLPASLPARLRVRTGDPRAAATWSTRISRGHSTILVAQVLVREWGPLEGDARYRRKLSECEVEWRCASGGRGGGGVGEGALRGGGGGGGGGGAGGGGGKVE